MSLKSTLVVSLVVLAITFAPSVAAESSSDKGVPMQTIAAAIKKVVFTPATPAPAQSSLPQRITEEQGALIFTAPPRETPEADMEMYQPVAEYLSKIIGKKIRYKHPGTWGVYRTEMLKGSYDIVFDGPHFNSYRMEKLSHNILVKIPERHEFAIIVRKDKISIQNVQQMAGRSICTHAPPDLGTLMLQSQFDNPSRQPVIISTNGWDNIYDGVASGKCTGGVLPMANLKQYDRANLAKVIFKTAAMPNQAFSAGPRVSLQDQTKIARALASPDAAAPTAKLRAVYKIGDSFALASNQEYQGLAEYLRSEWGYY